MTADFDQIDFFSDQSLNEDPYPYYEHLRGKCPITPTPHHGVLAVTGYDEASALAALSIFQRAALLIGAALLTVGGLKTAAQALRPAHA